MSENPLFSKSGYQPLPKDFALPKSLKTLDLGHHFVIFGVPGSGKTWLLRHLAAELTATRGPQATLTLTQSRITAAALRNEISLDGGTSSNGPMARSMSSFAFWLLDQDALAKNTPRPKLLSGASQQELLSALVNEFLEAGQSRDWGIPKAALSLAGFAAELRDQLTVFLEHQLKLDDIKQLQEKYPKLRLGPALDIYPRYLAELEARQSLDTAQLITRAAELLRSQTDLLDGVEYLLIDDAQELTPAGFDLIELISKQAKVGLFADPDATVLGFRSALGPKLTEYLQTKLPNLQKLDLIPEHSPNSNLELMRKITNRIPTSGSGTHRKVLASAPSAEAHSVARVFSNTHEELDFVATEIRKQRLAQNLNWDDFVLIARTRTQLEQIQSGLASRSVPTKIIGSQSSLRDQYAARSILNVALLVLDPTASEIDLIKSILLSDFCGIDSLGMRRLLRQLGHLERQAGISRSQKQILAELLNTNAFEDLDTSESLKLRKLKKLISEVRDQANQNAFSLISNIWQASELPAKWSNLARGNSEVAMAANRDLDSVLELFAAAERFEERNPGADPLEFVKTQLSTAVPEDSLAPVGYSQAVTLATPSALIGQRFKIGFLPRLQDGIWPNLRPRNSLLGANSIDEFLKGNSESPELQVRNELVDELRLLYKSVGAISDSVFLTAMQSADEQPSQFFNILFSKVPEVESFERDFDLRHRVGKLRQRVIAGESRAALELATLAKLGVPGADPAGWFGLLELSTNQPLVEKDELVSVKPSTLDAFERCPLHWFIQAHGGDGSGFEASLGTLIHEALEVSLDDPNALWPAVESKWHELEFEASWQETAQKIKAQQMVLALTDYIANKSGELVAAEATFEFVVNRLKVYGKIDRIERINGEIFVADLKTGKPGTKEEVANNRQLAIYQMATQQEITPGEKVAGAKIISVAGNLSVINQGPLEGKLAEDLNSLLERAELGMSGSEFTAIVSDHCTKDAACTLILAGQVTELG